MTDEGKTPEPERSEVGGGEQSPLHEYIADLADAFAVVGADDQEDHLTFRVPAAQQAAAYIRSLLAENQRLAERVGWLEGNMNLRDDFIVERGLWDEFIDWLPDTLPDRSRPMTTDPLREARP